ncbi:MAG: membrane dipeptidase [Deltaproteobacteria bacterium]|nr:MAG: membrane dipeptidase [Deltaproteobacteria bacterium]
MSPPRTTPLVRKSTFVALLLAPLLTLGACDQPGPSSTGSPTAPALTTGAAVASASAPCSAPSTGPAIDLKRAAALAKRLLIIDGHIDAPMRLNESRNEQGKLTLDVMVRSTEGDFDYPRAKSGGLDAPFMAIYIPTTLQGKGGAKALADKLIDMVEAIAHAAPQQLALAKTVAKVRDNFARHKLSLLLGIENGAAIEGRLRNLSHFHARGVRYITLTHGKDNAIGDSSYDDRHTHGGLSPLGQQVVAEMNRLGIMIDVSHVTDQTFEQAVALSQVPVIASHSGCRHFTPGWERNASDELIETLAQKGGVIMINFGSGFIDEAIHKQHSARWKATSAFAKKLKKTWGDPEVEQFAKQYQEKHPEQRATVDRVADHIDHVVKLVGIDHVGLGSDFDGLGDTLPTGLRDVSQYPNLIGVLLERGYSEAAIGKICSGNLLRVWRAVELHGAKQP